MAVAVNDDYFEIALAEIRGFDLGDDAELLRELQARRASVSMDGEDWLLLGVLEHRVGNELEAARCFATAAESGHAISQSRYLQSQVLARLGRFDEADATLDLAEAAGAEDELVPPAPLCHARGTLRRTMGDAAGALALYREGIDLDPSSATRWLDVARLLAERGELDDAASAYDNALAREADDPDALYERARIAARQADETRAALALAQAIRLNPGLRERARGDTAFTSVSAARATIASPADADLGWLAELPAWVTALRNDPRALALGLSWLGRDESDRLATALMEIYETGPTGTFATQKILTRSRALLANRRAVARGPGSRTRDGQNERCLLFVDAHHPDRLWLALSESYPPFLWIDAGTHVHSVEAALADIYPRPTLSRVQMQRVARGFMDYRGRFGVPNPLTGEVEPGGVPELDRHFALNPFLEAGAWGSAFDDDPWPDDIPPQPNFLIKMRAGQQRTAAQAPGSVWSMSRRTRHSRSYITVELHPHEIFVLDVRYRPSRHGAVVDAMNEHFGTDYPLDMPVDAVATILGFRFDGEHDLGAQLDGARDPAEIAGLLTVLASLRHSDLGMVRCYRRYMKHPSPLIRTTLCNIFAAYNFESLLEEMSAIEPDEELRAQIEQLLDEGIAPFELDPYAPTERAAEQEIDSENEGAEAL